MANPSAFQQNVLLAQDIPVTLVNAATGTGVTVSAVFSCPAARSDQPRTLTCQASGTFSVGTVTLLYSLGGNTFQAAAAAVDFHAFGVIQFTGIVPGVSYKLSVTSFTGTSVTIIGVIS
jgi:hypothetical protein